MWPFRPTEQGNSEVKWRGNEPRFRLSRYTDKSETTRAPDYLVNPIGDRKEIWIRSEKRIQS